jgi:hypothetical protein
LSHEVWFWQTIVTPHMAGLAAALASRGVDVTYVAEREMSPARSAQGWLAPDLGAARLSFAATGESAKALVATAPAGSIHICQGLRGNRLIGRVQQELAQRELTQWVVVETVDDSGWRGALKRLDYQRRILFWRNRLEGYTRDWPQHTRLVCGAWHANGTHFSVRLLSAAGKRPTSV